MEPVCYNTQDFLIAYKKAGIPTVPLKSQSPEGTLFGEVSLLVPQVAEVRGRQSWEGGTVHRIDTFTCGLVLFAKTQSFFDFIQEQQIKGKFLKTYVARTEKASSMKEGFVPCPFEVPQVGDSVMVQSAFRSWGPGAKEVRPVLRGDRIYQTQIARSEEELFTCTISQGFRHQIRSHLAWIGHPICSDPIYGICDNKAPECYNSEEKPFECVKLSFPLPNGTEFQFGGKNE